MNILITGGAGFIGSHACEYLIKLGHRVVALDNFDPFYLAAIKRRNLAGLSNNSNFKLVEGDYGDRLAMGKILQVEKFDTVLHLAGQPGIRSQADPLKMEKDNVGSLISFLEALKENGPRRIVAVSSSSVYGNDASPPFREDLPCLCPGTTFGATKRAMEIFLGTYSELYGIKALVVRPFNVYGPRQRPDMSVITFARKMLQKEPITLLSDGALTRDFIHIDDTLPVLARMLQSDLNFGIWNLGSGQEVSQRQIFEMLEKITGAKSPIQSQPAPACEVMREFADISKVKKDFQFEPEIKLQDGLQSVVAWLKQ